MIYRITLLLLTLAVGNLEAWAAKDGKKATAVSSQKFKVDTSKSKLGFKVYKFKISADVPGEFKEFSGDFEVDMKNEKLLAANGVAKTTSIFTDDVKRDNHLRSEDFFHAEKFPEVSFKLKSFEGNQKSGKLQGDLTMRGVTKPVVFESSAVDTSVKGEIRVTLTSKINRKDWGIIWNKVLDQGGYVLSDEVFINLTIHGKL